MTWVIFVAAAVIMSALNSAEAELDGQASKTRSKRESSISFLYKDLTSGSKIDHKKRFAIFREDRYPSYESQENAKHKIFHKMAELQNLRLRDRINGQDDVNFRGDDVSYHGDRDQIEKRQGRWDTDYGLGSGRFGKRSDVTDYDVEYPL